MFKALHYLCVGVTLCVAIAWLASKVSAAGPAGQKMVIRAEGDVFLLPEVGAVIMPGDDGLTIQMTMPPGQRPKEYKSVDLKGDDVILMVNGKRVKAVEDLKNLYDTLAVGDEIKMGIKRGKQMMIVAFPKINKEDMPQMKMMVMSSGDASDSCGGGNRITKTIISSSGSSTAEGKIINSDGSGPELVLLLEVGLILEEQGEALVIGGVMDEAATVFPEATLKVGDPVTSIQGKPVASAAEFNGIYDGLPTGETVKLSITHGGKEQLVTFAKPEATQRKVMIKR